MDTEAAFNAAYKGPVREPFSHNNTLRTRPDHSHGCAPHIKTFSADDVMRFCKRRENVQKNIMKKEKINQSHLEILAPWATGVYWDQYRGPWTKGYELGGTCFSNTGLGPESDSWMTQCCYLPSVTFYFNKSAMHVYNLFGRLVSHLGTDCFLCSARQLFYLGRVGCSIQPSIFKSIVSLSWMMKFLTESDSVSTGWWHLQITFI